MLECQHRGKCAGQLSANHGHKVNNDLVLGSARQSQVELKIEFGELLRLLDSFVHTIHESLQSFHVLVRRSFGATGCGQALQCNAPLHQVPYVVCFRNKAPLYHRLEKLAPVSCDGGALAHARCKDAHDRKAAKSLSKRRPACIELLAKVSFRWQTHARLKLPCGDLLHDLLHDVVADRTLLVWSNSGAW